MKFPLFYPLSNIEKRRSPKDSPLHVISENQNLMKNRPANPYFVLYQKSKSFSPLLIYIIHGTPTGKCRMLPALRLPIWHWHRLIGKQSIFRSKKENPEGFSFSV